MPRLGIVFSSTHGQTAKIVERIARRFEERGFRVERWTPEQAPSGPGECDLMLVAGPVYFGKHHRALVEHVRRHRDQLQARPSAFLSVCGALGGTGEAGAEEARTYERRFMTVTGWHPRLVGSVAGAVKYTQYRLPIRWLMKLISWRIGRPTDTSRDWEFTDWQQVDRLADDLLALTAPAPTGAEGQPASAP